MPSFKHAVLCAAGIIGVAAVAAVSGAAAAAEPTAAAPPIDPSLAAQIFRESRQISDRDGGRLWGLPLYGPMMLVEPDSRFLVTNQADARGVLKPVGEVFTGALPRSDEIANTATTWSGILWTQMIWPISQDPAARDVLIAHELFHRIRGELHLPVLAAADNPQLDTLQGRYLLQLEWRALAAALAARRDPDRRAAAADALLFRAQRHHQFPAAAVQETNLEYNEGLAEYTGVKVGSQGRDAQVQGALKDLRVHAQDSSFVRSFAYATGPAYGLLLDGYRPTWRQQLAGGRRLDELLAHALHVSAPRDPAAAVEARAARYDGATLLQAETLRDGERQKRLAQYRITFIEHPVLVLPLQHPSVTFDPREVQSFPGQGNVHPHLNASDDWGTLRADKGALVGSDWHAIRLSAPTSQVGGHLAGEGWILELKPGWTVATGGRTGDLTVTPADHKPGG